MATRKKCKKCRIMKCFRVGMRRDWIMTEVEREEKRRKIEENRRRKALGGPTGSGSGCGNLSLTDCNSSSPLDASKLAEFGFLNDPNANCDPIMAPMSNSGGSQFPIRRRRRRRRHSSIEMDNKPKLKAISNEPIKPLAQFNPFKPTKSTNNEINFNQATINKNQPFQSNSNNQLLMNYYQQNNPFKDEANEEVKRERKSRKKKEEIEKVSSLTSGYPQCSSPSICSTSSDSHDSTSTSPSPLQSKLPQKSETPLQQQPTPNLQTSLFTNDFLTPTISSLQKQQIDAIRQAYSQAIFLVKSQGVPKSIKDINTTINITELAVRRIIFYFKLISDFRNLPHDLMVTLLKNSMMSLLQIHGIHSYNKVDHTFKEPNTDDVPFSANSLEAVYGPDVYKIAMGVTRSLFDICDGDLTHIKVLMLIVLFEPSNEYLSKEEKSLIGDLQNKYITLLYAFLKDKFGSPKAELVYKSITFELGKIIELSKWFEKTVTERSNHEFVRPLMKEVLSIPPALDSTGFSFNASNKFSNNSVSYPASTSSTYESLNSVDSSYDISTPATASTSVSDSSFIANTNDYLSPSPNTLRNFNHQQQQQKH